MSNPHLNIAAAQRERVNQLPSVSIIVPAYDEEIVLPRFHERTRAVLQATGCPYEFIFVNDGSRDATLEVLHQLRRFDEHITIINLSRNFGKEAALTAGLDHACGDVVVIIDADLQDPPELIHDFLAGWREGYDVVYAVRTTREGESWFKQFTSKWFYRCIQRVSDTPIPVDTGDFRLMSRRAVQALAQLREQNRFMKGLFAWIGYPTKPVRYARDPRNAGVSKWNYWKLWNFALDGITSFSTAPLRISAYLGLFTALFAFLYAIVVIYKTLMFGDPVQGYPSLMVVTLFLGGVQLVFIGILGEYLGRIYNETKRRPLYLLDGVAPSELRLHLADSPEHIAPPDLSQPRRPHP
ncbi:glycosyltransferase family 2 protein [Desulfonatronum sp. SC1]|uniref:glycosyltransferase family 2 protein n=1 Tax=Desulfonatronum sp. SC1 TaxID=2109626 RepID=UPI000D3269C5|nr:glycosyltransferase family 2 protein [Desulfonatronum sp. SC1]PTN36514.1 glycosyl transferase family 2 [Desulfonatronum sp. SC1]